jgi:arabinofuranan 3-O-arabinosyltransferase
LDSITNQTSPCTEILVVDSFSNDGTDKIARKCGARVIQARANRTLARNIGAQRSSGSAVLFIDSDMILTPGLIEECERSLTEYQVLVIPETSIGNGFWATCRALERKTYCEGVNLLEAARCFQKKAFLAIGGYNSRLEAGEDWDLNNRARMKGLLVGRVRSRILHDEGSLTMIAILKKKFLYGKALGEYFRLNPRIGIRQANPLIRLLTPTLKSIPSDPVHGAGILLLKSLEFTAAGFGRLREISK